MKVKRILAAIVAAVIVLGSASIASASNPTTQEVTIWAFSPNPDFSKNEFTDTTALIPYHIWIAHPLQENYQVGITYWSKTIPATTIFLNQEISCPREGTWTLKNLTPQTAYSAIIFCSRKNGYFSSNVVSFKTRAPDIVVQKDFFAMTGKDKFKVSGELKNIIQWEFVYVDVQVTTICKDPNNYDPADPERTYAGSTQKDGVFCGFFLVNKADKEMDHWYRFVFYDKVGRKINETKWTKFKIPS